MSFVISPKYVHGSVLFLSTSKADHFLIIFNSNPMVKTFKKRNYVKVEPELRNQLIYRAVVTGKSVRKAARELAINYATAKVIVQK